VNLLLQPSASHWHKMICLYRSWQFQKEMLYKEQKSTMGNNANCHVSNPN